MRKPKLGPLQRLQKKLNKMEKEEIRQMDAAGPREVFRLETKQSEPEIFASLISIFAASYSGYHETHDIQAGFIVATQNDRAPASSFRISIAGSHIYTSSRCINLVRSWLVDGGTLKAVSVGNFLFSQFLEYLQQERQKTSPAKTIEETEKKVRKILDDKNREILAMCK